MGLSKKWEEESMLELKTTGRHELLYGIREKDPEKTLLVAKLMGVAKVEDEHTPLKIRSLFAVFMFIPVESFIGFVVFLTEYFYVARVIKFNEL